MGLSAISHAILAIYDVPRSQVAIAIPRRRIKSSWEVRLEHWGLCRCS